jgi:integrase
VSIRKRGTGRSARFDARYRDPDGQQRSRTFRTYTEAQRFLTDITADINHRRYINPSAGDTPLGVYAQTWLDGKHDLRPSTRLMYQRIISARLGVLATLPLNAVDTAAIRRHVAALVDEGLSPSRISSIVARLNQIFDQAVTDQLIVRNPATGVTVPKTGQRDYIVATPAEIRALDAAASDLLGESFGLLITFLAYTGLRWGEMVACDVADYDPLRGEVRVSKTFNDTTGTFGPTKNGKPRTVPLEPTLNVRMQAAIVGRAAADPLFPGAKGGRVRASWFSNRWWPRIKAAAKVDPALRPHDLRHTAISMLVVVTDIKTASEFAGHSSLASTARYVHTSSERLQAAAEKLGQLAVADDSGPTVVNLR